jgi:hypothetical protein
VVLLFGLSTTAEAASKRDEAKVLFEKAQCQIVVVAPEREIVSPSG